MRVLRWRRLLARTSTTTLTLPPIGLTTTTQENDQNENYHHHQDQEHQKNYHHHQEHHHQDHPHQEEHERARPRSSWQLWTGMELELLGMENSRTRFGMRSPKGPPPEVNLSECSARGATHTTRKGRVDPEGIPILLGNCPGLPLHGKLFIGPCLPLTSEVTPSHSIPSHSVSPQEFFSPPWPWGWSHQPLTYPGGW